jgi:hypothetical protein
VYDTGDDDGDDGDDGDDSDDNYFVEATPEISGDGKSGLPFVKVLKDRAWTKTSAIRTEPGPSFQL